jgi:hypothetical protein
MTQADLNRAVAAATGETVALIDAQGFEHIETPPLDREALVYDWDDEDARLFGETFD